MAPVAALIGVVGGAVAKLLSVETLKFIAMRAMMLSLFTVILPVVLYNVANSLLNDYLAYVSSVLPGSGYEGAIIELSGLGAWLAQRLQLVSCVSIFLAGVNLRWLISFFKR